MLPRNITLFTLSAAMIFGAGELLAQEIGGDRKVNIDIQINENGDPKSIKKEFVLEEGQSLEDALREMGVLEEFRNLTGDERLEIDIRRRGADDMLRDMQMTMFMNDRDMACEDADPKPWLGVYLTSTVENENGKETRSGAKITEVIEDAPAEKAGLRSGDVIVAIDGTEVNDHRTLIETLNEHEPGDEVKLSYLRDGKRQQTKVELGERKRNKNFFFSFEDDDGNEWNDVMLRDQMEALKHTMKCEDRAFLGVEGVADENGVRLTNIVEGSSAEKMGLLEGDVVMSINDEETGDFEELAEEITSHEPGDAIKVELMRDGKKMKLDGTLGKKAVNEWQHAFAMPEMPEMPEVPEALEWNEFYNEVPGEERETIRREMDALRAELKQLREELRGTITREINVVVRVQELTPAEQELLQSSGVTGLDNALEVDDLQCFPNPSDGRYELSFTTGNTGDLLIEVFNAKGERSYQERLVDFNGRYRNQLDLSEQADGTYFLVISQDGRTKTQKLVKQ